MRKPIYYKRKKIKRPKAPKHPRLRLSELEVSGHARERWADMTRQSAIEWQELILALTDPLHVERTYERWNFYGSRIKVCVTFVPHPVVVTVLWCSETDWELFPRS